MDGLQSTRGSAIGNRGRHHLRERLSLKAAVEYKNGFEVEVFVPKHGHATFSSNTMAVGNFIAAVYNRVENEAEFSSGKVPVVKVTGSSPIVTATGNTTYDIGFVVDKWIEMPDREESESTPVSQEVKEEIGS